MWQEIIDHLSLLYGERLSLKQVLPVGGGSINQTHRLQAGGYDFFVKLNDARKISMFETEAEGLREVRDGGKIKVPEPIGWGVAQNNAYLVLEWLDLGGKRNWAALASGLAGLHRLEAKEFGWLRSNWIGDTPQPNPWTKNWADFFWQHRLLYQLKLAEKRGFQLTISLALLKTKIYDLLANHQTFPSLVHGDLWGGNFGFDNDGTPIIFDPALYYGDREVDIAMTELFGGFASEFYEHYQKQFPLDRGYNDRKLVYNLYHILNHFNLFGGSYQYQAQQMINTICK